METRPLEHPGCAKGGSANGNTTGDERGVDIDGGRKTNQKKPIPQPPGEGEQEADDMVPHMVSLRQSRRSRRGMEASGTPACVLAIPNDTEASQ